MSKNKFYITTAIVYTNGPPHIGYAFELILTDVLARYHRLKGDDTYFLTGTDEHGSSVAKAAAKAGVEPQVFVDKIAAEVQELTKLLNVSNDDFIRTSDQKHHWPTPIKLWEILVANGDIYKKKYEGLYCVGHEAFIKKSDLVDGVCPLHKTAPEVVEEENWFFKITKYKDEIARRIENDDLKIVPESRKKEILNLIKDAEDVSFSRPSSTLKWGIPVPGDSSQTMYVWVDALSNYISALGYASADEKFKKFWPADIHLIGKDILRFHALIWPAILLSAEIELPKSIYVHGFINVDGQKMSKTIGNVVDPFAIVKKYGAEVVRYFLLREIPSDDDGDFSEKRLVERYNSELANGLGNLVARVSTLVEKGFPDGELVWQGQEANFNYDIFIDSFRLHQALSALWILIDMANIEINQTEPWKLIKDDPEEFKKVIMKVLNILKVFSDHLEPFMPETSEKIRGVFDFPKNKGSLEGRQLKVQKGESLFPRLEN